MWEDGTLIFGSTLERVVLHLSYLEVGAPALNGSDNLARRGMADPVARAVLTNRDGDERVVLIGAECELALDHEDRSPRRYYATVEGNSSVYLVHEQALERLRDLVRERNKKAEEDAARAERKRRLLDPDGRER